MPQKIKSQRIVKMRKLVVNSFVIALFAVPILLTWSWVTGIVDNTDHRKVIDASVQLPQYDSIRPFEEPLITVTFDDGWESIYSAGFPVLQEYNVRTTQYVLSGTFDHPDYMSLAQVKSMQDSGHDIASHTVDHPNLTSLDDEDLAFQITKSKEELEKHFGSIEDFASPLSAFDNRTMASISATYRSHRNTYSDTTDGQVNDIDVNIKTNFDRFNIYSYSITKDTTLDDIRMLIEYAKTTNGWVVLNYHQIDDSDLRYAITSDVLAEHMEYLRSTGMKLPTMREVLDIVITEDK